MMNETLIQLQNNFWAEHGFLKSQLKQGKRHCEYTDKVQDYFDAWLTVQEKYNLVTPEVADQATLTTEK